MKSTETKPGSSIREITGLDTLTKETYWLGRNLSLEPTKLRVLWVTESQEKAAAVQEQLPMWWALFRKNLGKVTTFVPNPLSEKTLSAEHIATLYRLLKNDPLWLATTLEVLDFQLLSPEEFRQNFLPLEKGQKITRRTLLTYLAQFGYEANHTASVKGTYAVRGSIIDIFCPHYDVPIRIDLDGSTISALHLFDWKTQQSAKDLETVDLIPHEFTWRSLRRGTTLKDYIHNIDTVISPNPEELFEEEKEHEAIWKHLQQFPHITLTLFTPTHAHTENLHLLKPPYYNHRLNLFLADLDTWIKEDRRIIITYRTNRVKDLLREQKKLSTATLFKQPSSVLESFIDTDGGTVFLTEVDIFGQTRREHQLKTDDLEFLSDLHVGDYVVHLDHGIGIFAGMTKNEVEGIKKEYFVLLYDEGDKLFVPVEVADKISKYVGAAEPKLHRLHGATWRQLTQQVQKSTVKTARDLLALYAKRELARAPKMPPADAVEKKLSQTFPYVETPDQANAIERVLEDMAKTRPMDRLVCGDVGFGKTEVAIRAAMRAVANGFQVSVLSPTTILTQQHYDTFMERLASFENVRIGILSRFVSPKDQAQTIEAVKKGEVDIIVGTHRLLSEDIHFQNLGLVIIDEEQRFGVKHKEKLKELRQNVHILTLTATPIPRTLHFALSGLRSITVIDTPPPGRLPIQNVIMQYDAVTVRGAITQELKRKGQVYYLYNKVETIGEMKKKLEKLVPEARMDIAHGQMDELSLMGVMHRFDQGDIDVLICSTIIENGLDISNVNTLLVHDAPQLGLAELYQLRGRVGRSDKQSHAFFFFPSQKLTSDARKRLLALKEAHELGSGLQVAQRDLEIRGTGTILGKEQHGAASAIGLTLYAKLLKTAIDQLKGEKQAAPIRDITIDLPLEAEIPRSYEPNEARRLKWYQKLAGITDRKELGEWKTKLNAKQKLPSKMLNLFDILEVRLRAQGTDILSIDTMYVRNEESEEREAKIIFKLLGEVKADILSQLLGYNKHFHFSETQVKISMQQLSENWTEDIKSIVQLFHTSRK